MKIIPMSDLHGHLPDPDSIGECDVICICGDIVPLEYQNDDAASIAWFCLEFVPWTDKLKCKKVIFIGGNHDFFLEHIMWGPIREDGTRKCRTASEVLKKLLPGNNKGKHKIIYLRDSSVEIEGKRFYGTPWISGLPGWAFNMMEEGLASGPYANIPKKLDVLLTHMPPAIGEVGVVLQPGRNHGRDFSSKALADAMQSRDITLAFCGHVHSGSHTLALYGPEREPQSWVVNVSVLDEDYQVRTYYFPVFEV